MAKTACKPSGPVLRRRRFGSLFTRALGVAALVAAAAPPAAAQVSPVGAFADLMSFFVRGVDIAPDSNGGYLVVGAQNTVLGVCVNAQGTPSGAVFTIKPASATFGAFARARYGAGLNNGQGGFMVVWPEEQADHSLLLKSRVVSCAGPTGPEQVIGAGNPPWLESGAAIAYSATSQRFLVTWKGAPPDTRLKARILDLSGAGIGDPLYLTTGFGRDPGATWNPNTDEFGVSFSGETATGAFSGFVKIPAGNPAAITRNTFNAIPGGLTTITDVDYNTQTRRYVMTWFEFPGTLARVAEIDEAGNVVSMGVASSILGSYDALSMAFNGMSGTFLLAGIDRSNDNLLLKHLNGNGIPIVGETAVIGTAAARYPRVAASVTAKRWNTAWSRNFLTASDQIIETGASNGGGGGGGTPPPPPPSVSAPMMSLDTPTDGNAFRVPISLYGWAVDKGAPSGTGVDAVHVWAYPNPGSGQAAIFVGAATYGQARGDVAAALGDGRFTNSGFSMPLSNLAAGVYRFVVSARSTVTGTFNQARTATVVIRGPLVALDNPTQNAQVMAPFVISGWAADSGAASGTGVDAVHVWVYPNPGSGAAPLFLGAATYGQARPDAAGAVGDSRFTNSGYSMSGLNLKPGPYLLVAFAHMAETGQWVPATANITVAPGPLMYVDAPFSGQSMTVWSVISGWAADMSSPIGTGIDAVHVWAYPANGAAPIFVGQANYGSDRPDVAGYIGARFRSSGFWLPTPRLPPGGYYFVAFARNATTQQFTNAVAVNVQVF